MIELKNVCKSFEKKVVLSNINLKFPSSGLFIIMGKNGVGKTTLLYILGLLDLDFKGDMIIENLKVKQESLGKIREYRNKNISYIFSKGNLIPYLNVIDNLKVGIEKEDDIIKFIDLPNEQDVRTLSGGEELLLSLSHEVSLNKKIYLLDEVTAALDDDNLKRVIEVLNKISKTSLVILVAHDERIKNIGQKVRIFE